MDYKFWRYSVDGLGGGYASVSVTDRAVYVTGREGASEHLTVLDLTGKQLWKIPYGQAAKQSYKETRCTPTVEGDRIYLISGRGEVVCVDANKKQIQWSVPAFDKFEGVHWYWEIAEQPLLVDDKIVFTPGGHKTSMVALDKLTGETAWQTESLHDTTAM
ncbi:MAG: PQQ-binding-like beta-propeller repeat protein, partial [bacterium]